MTRLTDEAFAPIVYVVARDAPVGTGFLVGVPDDPRADHLANSAIYVITARHVVTARDASGIRLNGLNGIEDAAPLDWWHSEDEAADVAAAYLPPSTRYKRRYFNLAAIVDKEALAREAGVGDQVATVGLFSRAPGVEQNRPIVRFGRIARLNEEVVPAELNGSRYELDAILVEMLSWPGQSGSVAIVMRPVVRHTVNPRGKLSSRIDDTWAVLGVVSGHWELPAALASEIEREAVDLEPRDESRHVTVNAGIALVTPGQHVLNLLAREDVVADRKRRRAGEQRRS